MLLLNKTAYNKYLDGDYSSFLIYNKGYKRYTAITERMKDKNKNIDILRNLK